MPSNSLANFLTQVSDPDSLSSASPFPFEYLSSLSPDLQRFHFVNKAVLSALMEWWEPNLSLADQLALFLEFFTPLIQFFIHTHPIPSPHQS